MRGVMFLRHTKRKKDGKEHRYWSIVENRRVGGGRVVQRPLLYLGEINDSQELAWRKSIAIVEEGALQPRTLSLFPEDRCEGLLPDASIVRLRLNELRLCRPRQWGGCWLALSLSAGLARVEQRFAQDSLRWEGEGFEPSVPREGNYATRLPPELGRPDSSDIAPKNCWK